MTGLQAAREISRRTPSVRTLMLSMHDNEQYFFSALQVGACGYVLKSAADEDLVAACRAAMRGESFLYAGVASTLVRDFLDRMRRGERMPRAVLTAREDEVVKLIAEGHSSKEIAASSSSATRPSNVTAPTSSPSWACETAQRSPGTRSGPDSSNPEDAPALRT